ncbi:MAG: conserved phage C-terminal domain-containing protein [Eubacterium sp.]|nr:conserved phage C-terminal domain-containing protein [Eubacterium sp.]
MEVFTNDICPSCRNESFEKCKADFTQITLDDLTRAVVDCELYKAKPKHKLKITYECEGKIAVVEKVVYDLPEVEWQQADKSTEDISTDDIKAIVEYLNEKLNAHYKLTGKKIKDLIRARMNEGYTVEDFKTVIDKKFKSWGNDPKMSLFLRPSTLFGTRFGEYLNEYQASDPNKLNCKPTYDLEKFKQDAMKNTEI